MNEIHTVSKGSSALLEHGVHGACVARRVQHGDGKQSKEVFHVDVRHFANTQEPQWHRIEEADEELQGGDGEGVLEVLLHIRIVNVVAGVKSVPQDEQANHLQSLRLRRSSRGGN